MKIMVTGGCGYKGSVLVPKLVKSHEVLVIDTMWFGNFLIPHPNLQMIKADIRELKSDWFEGIDAIIHLASVANDPCSELDPKLSWEVGALATMQLAEHAVRYGGVKQFIYASSGSVYGISDISDVTENTLLNPITEYNKNKMVSERVLLSYANDMIVQIVRPATVCGYSPRMRLDVSVNMLTMQALTKGLITVFGGNQTRPNIHIDDITDLYLFLLENKLPGIYNAGFENLAILDIAKLVQSFIKAEIKISPSNDPRSYRINSDKLLKSGFKPKKTVKNAIQELITLFHNGTLKDEDYFYNIRTMKAMAS